MSSANEMYGINEEERSESSGESKGYDSVIANLNANFNTTESSIAEQLPNSANLYDQSLQNDLNELSNFGITIMQSQSPPPHSYRNSRGYRHFKNPPQPHMCIRTTTETGEELFINVLSWTRIVIPQEPTDPIPLYGGMRVPPGSPRSPPIVFAVMANPEVLKDAGRHSKDPEERRAMVELMCDFVEAMNPGVKLVRNAVILKDRDITGELKDVWNAVQAQRDREREEQIMLQRQQQQQQMQNMNNEQQLQQQTFPKSSTEGSTPIASTSPTPSSAVSNIGNGTLVELAVFAKVQKTEESKDAKDQVAEIGNNVIVIKNETSNTNESADQIDAVSNAEESNITAPLPNNTATTNTTPKEKKEKLGGFLPNGCIFPRFKQNKHKDKDNNKESSKGKEKTLLQALKKNKDKKAAQNEKNCINKMECEMEKLDINKIEATSNNDSIFIKLKMSSNSATATAAK